MTEESETHGLDKPDGQRGLPKHHERAGKAPIRLLPPTFVDLPPEDEERVIELLADVIRRALRRRQAEGRDARGHGSASETS